MSSLTEGSPPKIIQSFQADRFVKRNNYLDIPDTIPEQSSRELRENCLKMEVSEMHSIKDETCKSGNNSLSSDDSSNASTVTPASNSFLKDCEKRLCDFSSGDEKSFLSAKSIVEVKDFKKVFKRLGILNDALSTPPNELRQQIKSLRNEVADIYEFHDVEIDCLKDERMTDDESDSYVQLFKKHIELLELYTTLKKEYEDVKNKHEKVTDELHYTTTNCLEKLCSQIEASDNSINLSNNSFASFTSEIKSSTMLGFRSEVETSVVNDRTLLNQDPLALSIDTPLRSSKKMFLLPYNCSNIEGKGIVRESINSEDIVDKKDSAFELSSDYTSKVLNVETLLCDKIKEMDDLENRLVKVEDVSKILQDECDRITSVSRNENLMLKKKLSEKCEELDKLTEKLLTETVALNPSLTKSLNELSTFKLLTIFIETIMEVSKNVQNQLIKKFDADKLDWEKHKKDNSVLIENLQNQIQTLTNEIQAFESATKSFEDLNKQNNELNEQLIEANKIISIRNDEINFLQEHASKNKKDAKGLACAEETISNLQVQLKEMEQEKINLENQCKHLEEITISLKKEIEGKETTLKEFTQSTTSLEDIKRENETLKETVQQLEEITNNLRNELSNVKKESDNNNDEVEIKLRDLKKDMLSLTDQNAKLECVFDSLLENKKIYSDIFADIYSNFNCHDDAVVQILNEKFQLFLNDSLDGLKNKKWLNILSEGIIACCNHVKKNMDEEISIKEDEWKIKLDSQTKAIENFNNQIKVFNESADENLNAISELKLEKENMEKLCESLKIQLSEAEKNILLRDCENITLKSYEEDLTKAKEDYSSCLENFRKLKSELLSVEEAKLEIENKYQELKEANENLQILVTTKDLILQDLDNFKANYDKNYADYEVIKQQAQESQLMVSSLKKQLEFSKTECNRKDDELQKLLFDIEIKENDLLSMETLKNQINDLNNKIKDYDNKMEELNKLKDQKNSVETILEENKNIISNLVEENNFLKSQSSNFKEVNDDLALAKDTIEKLKSDLLEANTEKKIIEAVNKEQDTLETNLQYEIQDKTKLIEKLQNQIKFYLWDAKENETKIKEITQENQNFRNLHGISRGLISEFEKTVSLMKQENEKTLEDILQEKENLGKLCDGLKEQLSEADKNNSLVKEENEKKLQEMLLEKESLEKLCNELKEQLSEANKNNLLVKEESETKLQEMLLEKQNLGKLCDELKEQLSEAKGNNFLVKEENEKKLQEMLLEKENLEKSCNELKEQLSELGRNNSLVKEESETKLQEMLLEKENLGKLCDELKEQLSEAKENNSLVKEENEQKLQEMLLEKESLEKLCNELKEQLSEAERNNSLVKEENEKKLQGMLQEKENFEKLCNELKEQLSEAERNNSLVKEENEKKLQGMLHEKENLEKLCEALKEQLSEVEGNNFEAIIKKQDTLVLNLQSEIQDKTTFIAKLQNQIQFFRWDFKENETKISEVTQEIQNFRNVYEISKGLISELENSISLMTEENEKKLQEILLEKENLAKLCDELKEQVSEAEKNNSLVKEESEKKLHEVLLEKENLEKISENYKEQLSEALKNLSLRDDEITVLKIFEVDLENAKRDLSSAEEALQKFKIEVSELENKNLDLENKCFELEKAVENLENSSATKDKILKDLENYKATSEKIQNDYQSKIEKLEHLKGEYNELKEDLERAENAVSLHKKEIDILQSHNEKAEEKLTCALETIEKLQAQVIYMENEKINLKDECKKLEENFSKLKSEINAKDIRLEEVEKEIMSYEHILTENKNLKESILDMEKITKSLKEELELFKEEANNIANLKDVKLRELNAEILSLGNKNNQIEKLYNSLVENKGLFPNAFSSIYSTSNVWDDAVVKSLHDKLKSSLNYSFDGTEDEKWLSVTSEAIISCCNFLKEELNKESMSKEVEWKVKVDGKVTVIENLEIQIDRLRKTTEKNDLQILEMKLEKDKFEKLCENMKVQLNEGEKIIEKLENEMLGFKSCKEDLNKAKLDLVATNDKILNLKSKLLSVENEKWEIENRCIQLEEEANSKGGTKDMTLRSGRTVDLRSRRMDKLEDINNNLMELINSILNAINFPNVDKLKLMSVRDYPSILKKINAYIQEMESKTKNLESANAELDEECESYAKTIKDLKKEAAAVWKANKEKTEALELEIEKLKKEQAASEQEKENLLAKVSKLDSEYQKLKAASLPKGTTNSCNCGGEVKKIHELKRAILIKEQKILELEDLENQNSLYKSQIKYLENALEQEKKKIREETKKNKKLQNEINELTKAQKPDKENSNDNEMLEELKLRGSISGGVVKDFMDKEKMRKLAKDIEILKEVCRARYTEIKRLEAENSSLKNSALKNSNQMDSPIRTRSQRRSKTLIKEMWKPEVDGKENIIRQ